MRMHSRNTNPAIPYDWSTARLSRWQEFLRSQSANRGLWRRLQSAPYAWTQANRRRERAGDNLESGSNS